MLVFEKVIIFQLWSISPCLAFKEHLGFMAKRQVCPKASDSDESENIAFTTRPPVRKLQEAGLCQDTRPPPGKLWKSSHSGSPLPSLLNLLVDYNTLLKVSLLPK